jgi:hypothetical protein
MDAVPHVGWNGDPSVLHRVMRSAPRPANSVGGPPISILRPSQPDVALADGQTYQFQGLTMVPRNVGAAFANGTSS